MCGGTWYRAMLAAMWTETFFYGIHALLFAGYAYIHLTSDTNGGSTKIMISAATIMFALSTTLMLNDFIDFLLTPALTVYTECIGTECGWCDGVADNVWEDVVYDLATVISVGSFTTNQLIADALPTYRCYVVWQSMKMIVVLPAVMVLAMTVAGYAQTHIAALIYLSRRELSPTITTTPAEGLQLDTLGSLLNYVTSGLALGTNLLVTGLIASRVWWVTRELESSLWKHVGRRYRAAIAILVESGAIYSAALLIQLMTYKSPQSYGLIVNGTINQLVGIIPTMIMVRVALARRSAQLSVRESNVHEYISPISGRVLSQPIAVTSASVAHNQEAREVDVSQKVRRRTTIKGGSDTPSDRGDEGSSIAPNARVGSGSS